MLGIATLLELCNVSTEGSRLVAKAFVSLPKGVKWATVGAKRCLKKAAITPQESLFASMESYLKHTRLTKAHVENIEECLVKSIDADVVRMRGTYQHLESTLQVAKYALEASRQQINSTLLCEGRKQLI